MISLTRLNKKIFILNSDLIESIEASPDTTIKLITGQRIVVRESIEEIVSKVKTFKGEVIAWAEKLNREVKN